MRKKNKAALARQKQVLPAETIPEPSDTITDGMSLVQKMEGNDQTFYQHINSALTHILHEGVRSHIIDVVFVTYREDSIKNAKISNRNGAGSPDPAMEKVSEQLGRQGQPHKVPGGRIENTQAEGHAE